MIELHQFPPMLGLMNASSFCMKVEVFLRLAGLEYRVVSAAPPGQPKGKLPVVRDAGLVVPDSEAIVAHLQRAHGARIPRALAAPETPRQLLLRRVIEEHLYFVIAFFRWSEDAGWVHTRGYFAGLPAPLRGLVGALFRRRMRRALAGQGLGRHRREEIAAKGAADLDAVAAELGTSPFFGGTEPAAIDASAYASLANLVYVPVENPLKAHVRSLPNLMAYCERMKARVGA
ncbi:glutathione S-transferase C-terminal domain-containing protein [Piscinibacter sp.]|jgi:glutathione S-transferase|uniref:glutathione S-transferase C-terminal domain-containing protein n=1 Tax=Piscinibacter sp. TaxID=1903157 RepID=UPI002F3F5E71